MQTVLSIMRYDQNIIPYEQTEVWQNGVAYGIKIFFLPMLFKFVEYIIFCEC